MSNFLAVATVTAALQRILQATVGTDVSGAEVWTDRPDAKQNGQPGPGVNIYLYEVVPNPALRNDDLPTRDSEGQVFRRPQVALDLHYLLTFYGADDALEPQRLLGSVVRTLHAQPLLSDQVIEAVQNAATDAPPIHEPLATTNLADQIEQVRFTPLSLNLEELSKLWSVFFQTSYALSVAYQASVVLIDEDVTPEPAIPVLDRDLEVGVFLRPFIDDVVAEAGEGEPVFAGDTIHIRGRDLLGDVTLVRIAGSEFPPVEGTPTEVRFAVAAVPPGSLRVGPQPVQIVQQTLLGVPPTPHAGSASNVAVFVLHPTVVSATATGNATSGTVTVETDLTIRTRQRVALTLLNPATAERERVFGSPERTEDTDTLQIPISGMTAGEYLVQVLVDGAASQLEKDGGGNFVFPKITLS